MNEYVLVGYFRFIISDKSGVVGEVVSKNSPGWAEDSSVPVYRKLGETKATLQIEGCHPEESNPSQCPALNYGTGAEGGE